MSKMVEVSFGPQSRLNLNSPEESRLAFEAMAKSMLESSVTDIQQVGMWVKSLYPGFVNGIAEAQKLDHSIDTQISAATNAMGTFLAIMIGATGVRDVGGLAASVCMHMANHIMTNVAHNQKNVRPCDCPAHSPGVLH